MTIPLYAGVDEVGRGCLCGDVVAAAVILNKHNKIQGLADSKTLSAIKRENLAEIIIRESLGYSIISLSARKIDEINILNASLLAMKYAIQQLKIQPDIVYVDGNHAPSVIQPVIKVIKGDQWIEAISAASILAKVHRDSSMMTLHQTYPQYGFDRHKGYPTRLHLQNLEKYGVLDCYRMSYKPVQKIIYG